MRIFSKRERLSGERHMDTDIDKAREKEGEILDSLGQKWR